MNTSGGNYLYIAFASDPSSTPTLANSFTGMLYNGTSQNHSIQGLGFSPSLVWTKDRDNSEQHQLHDTFRGATNAIASDSTAAEVTRTTGLTSFDSDGFTLGTDGGGVINDSARGPYVAWAWKAGTPQINTDGSTTAIVSANVAAGFSMVHLPDHSGSYTVGHGLDGVPDLIITRVYDGVSNWLVYNSPVGARNYMFLNTTAGNTAATPGYEYDSVTATTFTNLISASTLSYIHYCFKSIAGFSNVGSYNGNSSTQSITGLGFQPSWVMIKRYDGTENWYIQDSARGSTKQLYANLTNAEFDETTAITSFDSDGWTMGSYNGINNSGESYIYLAFKENPSPQPAAGYMSYLVVAGGGSGGAHDAGSGGAGGLRTSYGAFSGGGAVSESDITLAAGTYTITVGAGGAAIVNPSSPTRGNAGTNSVLNSITSIGGGEGGTNSAVAGNGGSGGGGTGSYAAGSGTAGQGFQGGTGTPNWTSGGGGGAAEKGQDSPGNEIGGDGGNGLYIGITGSITPYAGGGGGGGGTTLGKGGQGGGGTGGNGSNTPAGSGQANTGGGGGAQRNGGSTASGAGGSGVVILRLATSEYSGTTTGSPTVTTDGDYTILTYTGSGTYVHS